MHIQMQEVLLFIHIMLGITWLGGILFVGWGVYPAANTLSFKAKRQFLYKMMKQTHILLTLAGISVIVTGILLGTIFGPIHDFETLTNTYYGNLFSYAFLFAFFGLLWGSLVSYRVTMNMLRNNQLWDAAINGTSAPLNRMMRQVTFISSLEVLCLLIVVWVMVLI